MVVDYIKLASRNYRTRRPEIMLIGFCVGFFVGFILGPIVVAVLLFRSASKEEAKWPRDI